LTRTILCVCQQVLFDLICFVLIQRSSFFVYNTKKKLPQDNLNKIKDAGFKIIKYTKDPLDEKEYDKVINQIKNMQNGNLVINGYDYGKISNKNYIEDILGCDRSLNDRETLIYMLDSLYNNHSWNEPHENLVQQIIDFRQMIGEQIPRDCVEIAQTLKDWGYPQLISQKQWKILYPMANDILFKRQTLRTTIDNIPEIYQSYQNSYCEENGITKYTHPTPCFNYMGGNYKLGDKKLMSAELTQNKLNQKALVGRHKGLYESRYPTNFIDSIQYYTSFPLSETVLKPKEKDIKKMEKRKK